MLGPPLQYQSLQAVLQHMDANARFRISVHMPSIRSVEKVVPLKINHLELCDRKTEINQTAYQLVIVRYYSDKNTPERTEWDDTLGSPCDFDKYGIPVTGNIVLLPGDISFREKNQIEKRFDTEEDERRCRYSLRVREKALERVTGLKSKGTDGREDIRDLKPPHSEELSREEKRIRLAAQFPSDLPHLIEEDKRKLLLFDSRRNNTKPPLTCYIQLTTDYGRIQLFEYNRKLYEAVKYLHQALFGGRTMPIRVDRLHMRSDGLVCRLPVGFRLLANDAHVHPWIASHKNLHSLVENSNRSDSVWIVARHARKVVIVGSSGRDMQKRNHVLRDKYYLPYSWTSVDYYALIGVWLTGDRPVGASFWIELKEGRTAREILRLVGIRYEKIEENERYVTIRRNDSTNVEVSYVPFVQSLEGVPYREGVVKFRIVNV